MKILYISDNLKGNAGWSRYARDLIFESKKNGADALCLVHEIDKNTDIEQASCLKNDPSAYLANPIVSYLNAREVNRKIKEFSPDIIHIIVEPYGTMIPFIRKGKAKIVVTVHSTFAYIPLLLKGIRRKISELITISSFKKIDSIISVSKYTEDHLKKNMTKIDGLKYLEGKLNIVSGGVADSSIDATVRSTMDNNPKEILFVGALKPRKGLIESIEALSKVKTDFVYRIVGAYDSTNPYVKLMQEKIKIYGLEKRVILLGSVSDTELDNLYKKADLFLMLSTNNGADFEGYGLVYLEANGRGVPVIGPNDSGVSDAVLDGKTGYLVDQYDPALVAGIIDNLLVNNPIKAQDCVDWARQNTSRIKAQKVWQIYNEINSR